MRLRLLLSSEEARRIGFIILLRHFWASIYGLFNFASSRFIDFVSLISSISFHGKSELRRQQEVDEDRGGRR